MVKPNLPTQDAFRAYCVTNSYPQEYNEGLFAWLTVELFTQATLQDKIYAACAADFDWILN